MLPGSEYTYIRRGFGEAPAFLLLWVLFVFRDGCAKAVLALTFATYFGQVNSSLEILFGETTTRSRFRYFSTAAPRPKHLR